VPIAWIAAEKQWAGQCKPIPCSDHAGTSPFNCVCEKVYYPDGLAVQGIVYVGKCSKRDCSNNQGVFPDCNCTVGYSGHLVWDTAAFDYSGACSTMACPANSLGRLRCDCNPGFSGSPA